MPADILPADKVFVRLAGENSGCNLQVYNYGMDATFTGAPLKMCGSTRYVEKMVQSDKLSVQIARVDFDAESQKGSLELLLANKSENSFKERVCAELQE